MARMGIDGGSNEVIVNDPHGARVGFNLVPEKICLKLLRYWDGVKVKVIVKRHIICRVTFINLNLPMRSYTSLYAA
jgi:hypothetical protein